MPSEPSEGFISPAVLRPARMGHAEVSRRGGRAKSEAKSLRRFAIWRRHEWRRRLGADQLFTVNNLASLEEEAGLNFIDALENSQSARHCCALRPLSVPVQHSRPDRMGCVQKMSRQRPRCTLCAKSMAARSTRATDSQLRRKCFAMRITFSATSSASCSYISSGVFTLSFAWSLGAVLQYTGIRQKSCPNFDSAGASPSMDRLRAADRCKLVPLFLPG